MRTSRAAVGAALQIGEAFNAAMRPMPVATPPNAVVFGSGQLKIGQFIKAGIYGNILGLIITMLIGFTMVRWVFGIELGVLPDWAIK